MNPLETTSISASPFERWVCPHHSSPVLLAMVDNDGHMQIKVRDRIWLISEYSTVTAICPKCGRRHTRRIIRE